MTEYEGPKISSAEFRKTYAKLLTPTMVTANGHVIGVWVPSADGTSIKIKLNLEPKVFGADQSFDPEMFGRHEKVIEVSAQAQRDAILRRINKHQ